MQSAVDYRDGQEAAVMPAPAYGLSMPSQNVLDLPGAGMICALFSAALLTISFPDVDLGAAAWVALVPIAVACARVGLATAFGLGLLAGLAATLGIFDWIFNVPHFGLVQGLPLALYLSLYPALWCAGLVVMRRSRAPVIITGASLWVALDFLRAHAGFLAIPWATLAQSQHADLALLQTASLTGEAGITFAVVAVNLAIVTGLTNRQWRPLALSVAAVALLHVGGAVTIADTASAGTLQVAVVQPSITRTEAASKRGWNGALGRLVRLTRAAQASSPGPALVVWPETVVRDFGGNPAKIRRIERLAVNAGVPIILGASDVQPEIIPTKSGFRFEQREHNAAWLIPAHGAIPKPYDKMVLLPFAEYRPLAPWMHWPQWLAPWMSNVIRGRTRALYRIDGGARVAPIICWENLFADRVRHSVADGAQLIVHLANDNWFGASAEPRQHELASVMRAVENRVPVIVASNTGPSEIIASSGRVIAQGPGLFTAGILTAQVVPGTGSFYTAYGDLFAWLCVVTVLIAFGSVLVPSLMRGGNRHQKIT